MNFQPLQSDPPLTYNNAALISAIQYFPYGGPESWLLGANVAGTKDYTRLIDLNSRIAKYSTPTGYRGLTFDNASRITQIGNYLGTSTTASGTQSFTYDNAGRLLSFNGYINNGNNAANITQTQSFTYDANGNRLTSKIGTATTSTYTTQTTSNRLTSITGGITKTNTYDTAGNLTNDGTTSLTYDGRGRMLTSTSAGLTTSYLINYAGQRVKKANSTETVYYIYDDSGHMIGEYDAAGTLIQELIWLGDTPVALRGKMPCLTGGTCTETANAYVWTDHLNTPREITRVNASNAHVSMWKWDSLPFGETLPNANPTNLGVMTFNHRFPGQYRDKETGLHQNWNRDYEPKIGRYVTSDPLGLKAGTNTYGYTAANPVSSSDAMGLDPGGTPGGLFCIVACQPDPQAYAYQLRLAVGFDNPALRQIENFFEGFQHQGPQLGNFIGQIINACYQLSKPIQQILGESETGFSYAAGQAGSLGITLASQGWTLDGLRRNGGCSCGGQ